MEKAITNKDQLEKTTTIKECTKSKFDQLSEAAFAGHLNRIKRLAKELDDGRGIAETIANIRDSDGRGVLHLAAVKGRTNVCKYLLEELKIYVDDRDREDCTALVHASLEGHLSTVNCLIENGADLAARDKFNATALHSATLDGLLLTYNVFSFLLVSGSGNYSVSVIFYLPSMIFLIAIDSEYRNYGISL
ncbi:hypothetical protein ACHQM5_014521 [Ranunculus cassubicifolius]